MTLGIVLVIITTIHLYSLTTSSQACNHDGHDDMVLGFYRSREALSLAELRTMNSLCGSNDTSDRSPYARAEDAPGDSLMVCVSIFYYPEMIIPIFSSVEPSSGILTSPPLWCEL